MVRDQVAAQLTLDKASVYVIRLVTRAGTRRTYGRIHVYDAPHYGLQLEPRYIQQRNNPKAKAAEPEERKEAETETAKPAKEPKPKKPSR